MTIYVHGALAFDNIKDYPAYFKDSILPDNIHQLNVSFQIDRIVEKRGGTGGNISYNLALMHEHPKLVGSTGEDAVPYIEFLREQGVDMEPTIVHANYRTSIADIITDKANNQMTAFYVGAAAQPCNFSFKDIAHPEEVLLILSPANNIPDTMRFIAEAKELGMKYIFDPGQTTPDFSKEQIIEAVNGAYIVIMNDYELELMQNIAEMSEEEIRDVAEIVIKTLGKEGSHIMTADEIIKVPICKEFELVDPTGAGDAYRAGFMKGIINDLPLYQCGLLGATAASFAIAHHGTQDHYYSFQKLRDVYEKHFGETCPV